MNRTDTLVQAIIAKGYALHSGTNHTDGTHVGSGEYRRPRRGYVRLDTCATGRDSHRMVSLTIAPKLDGINARTYRTVDAALAAVRAL